MKSMEVPKPVVAGIVAVVALIVVAVMYSSFVKGPPQVDATKISPERLRDPDRERGSTTGPSGRVPN